MTALVQAPILRRGVLGGVLAAPAVWRRLNAQGLRKIRFTLPWLPEGGYAASYVAKVGGFWSKRGFDVEVDRGYGSLASGQAIYQGTFEIGLSNAQAVVLLGSKGLDLRGLALLDYDPGMAVAVLRSSGIKAPKDLEGKTVGQTLTSADAPFFKPFCELTGVDITKVRLQNMDARVRNQALVQKSVDAITGFSSSILPTMGTDQDPIRFILYRDYGLKLYGNVLLTVKPETLEKEVPFCQGILDGLMEALKLTETQPETAQEMFLSALPEMRLSAGGAQFARLGLGMQRFSFVSSPDPLAHAVGWMDVTELAKMSDLVMRYQAEAGAAKPDVGRIFTNQLVGGVTMSAAEWEAVKGQTAWVDALLHPPA